MGEELKNSIKAKLYDFAYTPFMSSYVISWILLNHKYLLVYFGTSSLDDKLLYLGECHLEFLLPLYIALIYVFIYPAIGLVFYYVTLWYNKKSMKIKQQIEDETPITQEQAREIRREHYKLADERDQALEKLKESQKEHAEALANTLKPLQDQIESFHSTQKVSDELIQKMESENQKIQSQLDQSNKFLMSKNDEYAELEKKVVDLERQLASVGVINANVKIGGVEAKSLVAGGDTNSNYLTIIKYLHDEYDTDYEANILEKMYKEHTIPKAETRKVLNDLVKQEILSKNSINQIMVTEDGNQKLNALLKGD